MGLFFLRFGVAAVFMYHSIGKLRDPERFAHGMGWNFGQALGLGIIEFMSALAVLGGVGAGTAALFLMIIMAGAIYHKVFKWNIPFMGRDKTGWELDFLLFLACFTIYLRF